MTDRYHVQVRVREGGDTYAWRRVHPVGGDPYVFTKDEAEAYVRSAGGNRMDPENWRLEELPAPKFCPYAKSDMTPCVLRDGPICFALNDKDEPICVGCERTPEEIGAQR